MYFALLGLTTFFALGAAYFLRVGREEHRRRTAVERAGRLLAPDADPEAVASILRETQSDLGSMLSDAAARYPTLRKLELLLYRAGKPMTLAQLLGSSVALAVGGAALGSLLGFGVLPGLLAAGPLLYVKQRKRGRMKTFDEQFPSALALFSRALRAGHSMSSALTMVGTEMPDPVGPEFALVAREISFGLAPATAMANLQDRLDAQDLPVFVTAVLVQLETGGNLAETLDNLGDVIRSRLLFFGKVKALTAQSMMSANILVVVPFVIVGMMSAIQPEFTAPLFENPLGQKMLMAAGVMTILGWMLCRKMARVDV
jgi:tight adherence protein B